jgi:hypothetical protein
LHPELHGQILTQQWFLLFGKTESPPCKVHSALIYGQASYHPLLSVWSYQNLLVLFTIVAY